MRELLAVDTMPGYPTGTTFPNPSTPDFPISIPDDEAKVFLGILVVCLIILVKLLFLLERERKYRLAAKGLARSMLSSDLSRSSRGHLRREQLRRFGALKPHHRRRHHHHRRHRRFSSAALAI